MTEDIDPKRLRLTEEGRKLVEKDTGLKPCPFCGGEAEEWKDSWMAFTMRVGCRRCGISFEQRYNDNHIKMWNRRSYE